MVREKCRALFCAVLLLVQPAAWGAHRRASSAHAGNLAERIAAALAEPAAAQALWGISIATLDGRAIYRKNDAELFAPASNAKLFTTAAALALLGPQATVETRISAAAAPDATGTVHGSLTLTGAADAGLSGRAYPYSGRNERPGQPLDAIASLADQVAQHGVRRVEGNIVGDDTAFPQEPYGAGWAWDDLEWSWGAPVSALTVNDNVLYLTVTPGARPGDPLAVAWNPEMAGLYYTVGNLGRTSAAGSAPSLGVDRPVGAREIRVFGTLPAGGAAKHLALAIADPAEFAALALKHELESRGVAVTGAAVARHRPSVDTAIFEQSVERPLSLTASARVQDAPPAGAVVLAARRSVPLVEDVTVTNKVSQNLHAELLLRRLGQGYGEDGSVEEGARVVRAFLLNEGIAPEDFFFYDGSGLSPLDRVTPRAVTGLLEAAARAPWGAAFRASLPVGGVDGSLAGRFSRAGLRGRVFAKTGTLDEDNALSGYVETAGGRTLVFSILCNGHRPGARGIAQAIDAIVAAVAVTN